MSKQKTQVERERSRRRKWVAVAMASGPVLVVALVLVRSHMRQSHTAGQVNGLLATLRHSGDPDVWLDLDTSEDALADPMYVAGQVTPYGEPAVPTLISALSDEYTGVRIAAARALLEICPTDKAAIPALTKALADREELVRREALTTLGYFGPDAEPAVPAIMSVLNREPLRMYKWQGHYVLEGIGPAAVPGILAGLRSTPDDSIAWNTAMRVIRKLGPGAVEPLTKALTDDDRRIRSAATCGLGWIGPGAKAAIPALERALKDPQQDVRRSAVDALRRIRAAQTQPASPNTRPPAS